MLALKLLFGSGAYCSCVRASRKASRTEAAAAGGARGSACSARLRLHRFKRVGSKRCCSCCRPAEKMGCSGWWLVLGRASNAQALPVSRLKRATQGPATLQKEAPRSDVLSRLAACQGSAAPHYTCTVNVLSWFCYAATRLPARFTSVVLLMPGKSQYCVVRVI